MGLEIGKLCAKPRVSVKMGACYVTNKQLLCQVSEQLKERLKSQKEENRNCLLKIVQSMFYFPAKALVFVRARSQISSSSSELDDEVLRKWVV